MMQGWMNQNCEAMLPIVVGYGNTTNRMVEALIGNESPVWIQTLNRSCRARECDDRGHEVAWTCDRNPGRSQGQAFGIGDEVGLQRKAEWGIVDCFV